MCDRGGGRVALNSFVNRQSSGKTPDFVKPFLSALTQIHEGDAANRADYIAHAERGLEVLRGGRDEAVITAFARGSIGLQADHTHYFNGFALMLPMHRGIGVALTRNLDGQSRLIVDGTDGIEMFSRMSPLPESASDTVRLFKCVMDALDFPDDEQIDISVASGIPAGLVPSFAAAFAVGAHRALEELRGTGVSDIVRIENCRRAIENFLGRRFSPAYIRVSNIQETHSFVLVDTQSLSFVPVDVPESERPGWGLIDTHEVPAMLSPEEKLGIVETITKRLKDRKFVDIASIRDIEHRDIDEAEKLLSRRHRSTFRFLVTENRRVQQLVTAIRRKDWQLCGTILLISHEARRTEWRSTTPSQEEVVDLTERFSHEGVYGATQTGESSCILVVGQPFSIPGFLDEVRKMGSKDGVPAPDAIVL
jgi:galactokinase